MGLLKCDHIKRLIIFTVITLSDPRCTFNNRVTMKMAIEKI
jgi:hypothetical protein